MKEPLSTPPDEDANKPAGGPERPLSPAAQRALSEAAARRADADKAASERPRELGGRDGPDPARYGDWEKGGIVSDF